MRKDEWSVERWTIIEAMQRGWLLVVRRHEPSYLENFHRLGRLRQSLSVYRQRQLQDEDVYALRRMGLLEYADGSWRLTAAGGRLRGEVIDMDGRSVLLINDKTVATEERAYADGS